MKIPVEAARPLRGWLAANALFSVASGAAVLVASSGLPGILGAGARILYVVLGAMVCLYGVRLWWLRRRPLDPREVRLIIGADALWVLGSIALVLADTLTPVGDLLVGAAAVVVGAFAVGQATGLRRLQVRAATPVGSSRPTP